MYPPLADRTAPFLHSKFKRIFELSRQLKNPINLGMGQPHFDVPDALKEVAIQSIRNGFNGYTLPGGTPDLRAKIKQSLDQQTGHADEVVITCGTLGALTLAFPAILNPGDEVILFDPYFVAYPQLATLNNVTTRFISTYPDFQPDPERVRAAITPRTKAILLCTPGNPTGVVAERSRVKALAELADHHGIWLISDEIYSSFVYDNSFVSPACFGRNVIVCSSFSKTHGMTGWRLGYAYGPAPVIQAMTALQQSTFVCAPSNAQAAGLAAWDFPMVEYVQDYQRKRDWALTHLDPKYQVVNPGGAFYLFPRCPQGTGTELAEAALQQNLVLMPGMVFSQQDTHFRISFAVDDQTLEKGIILLNRL